MDDTRSETPRQILELEIAKTIWENTETNLSGWERDDLAETQEKVEAREEETGEDHPLDTQADVLNQARAVLALLESKGWTPPVVD